eukprot:CAMPEP_0175311000 /NCGR_PEP_ID=MMETSP0093-20121207/66613_1 /TAXON_ID=311494 /ORGANISM="Alexandrium monilatum, Strain CCMP3105" /LENGTH=32 /DNA_ID= /DNA_START= /DNA_END= /DNA_ORIENTATION=
MRMLHAGEEPGRLLSLRLMVRVGNAGSYAGAE